LDAAQFFGTSRVVIVAGKGGVGKTAVSAAVARAAALAGLSTLIIEVEGKSGLSTLFGQPPFYYDEVVRAPAETRTIVLGGGSFWCLDALFRQLAGITLRI